MCKAGSRAGEARGSNPWPAGARAPQEEAMSHAMGWTIGAVLAVAGVGVPVWWLTSSRDAPEPEKPQIPKMDSPDEKPPAKKTDFATGDDKVAEIKFDGANAVKY